MKAHRFYCALLLASTLSLNNQIWADEARGPWPLLRAANIPTYSGPHTLLHKLQRNGADQAIRFEIQLGTSDLQNSENVHTQAMGQLVEGVLELASGLEENDASEVPFIIQLGISDLQNGEKIDDAIHALEDDQSLLQFEIQMATSDLQNAEDINAKLEEIADAIDDALEELEDDQSLLQFEIQMGTSDLQNAENLRSQAEKRLETQRQDLSKNWGG